MSLTIKPVKIKDSTYLLVPKSIAKLIGFDDECELSLEIKKNGKGHILEYKVL